MFEFQRFVSTVAGEGLSVAMQHVFILIDLFDRVVSSAEGEVRNSFFPSICSNVTQKFVSQTHYYRNLCARKRFVIACSYLAFAAF